MARKIITIIKSNSQPDNSNVSAIYTVYGIKESTGNN